MEQNEKNHKIINSMRCAGYLMFNGCRLIRTEVNQDNPKYNVFVFYDDELVKHYLTEFTNTIKDGDSKDDENRKALHIGKNRKPVHRMEK